MIYDYRDLAPTKVSFETVKPLLGKEISFLLYRKDVTKNKMEYEKVVGIVKKVVYDEFGYHFLWIFFDNKLYLVCRIIDEITDDVFWMCTWADIDSTCIEKKDILKILNDGSLLSIKYEDNAC